MSLRGKRISILQHRDLLFRIAKAPGKIDKVLKYACHRRLLELEQGPPQSREGIIFLVVYIHVDYNKKNKRRYKKKENGGEMKIRMSFELPELSASGAELEINSNY